MIRTPPRAVTRFLIPFIDVLILLFCIFLLMPFVSQPGDGETAGETVDVEKLQQDLQRAERRLAELKNEKANLFDRYRVKILEIDPDTGRLFDFEPGSVRQEVRSQADATALIHKERARSGAKELCIQILYPRQLTGFPELKQIQNYSQWFRDVPYVIDTPWLLGN